MNFCIALFVLVPVHAMLAPKVFAPNGTNLSLLVGSPLFVLW